MFRPSIQKLYVIILMAALCIAMTAISLNSKFIDDVKIDEHSNGKTTATVKVVANKTGAIVGREGRNAEKARLIAKRYFEINKLKITNE